jgi:hypothetical protein
LLEETRCSRSIGRSVLDFSWMNSLSGRERKHFLFLAEGANLIFDACSPTLQPANPCNNLATH